MVQLFYCCYYYKVEREITTMLSSCQSIYSSCSWGTQCKS